MITKTLAALLATLLTTGLAANNVLADQPTEEVTFGWTEVDAKAQSSTAARKGVQDLKTNAATPVAGIDDINKPSDPQAISGGLDRDIIRRIQTPKPKPNN